MEIEEQYIVDLSKVNWRSVVGLMRLMDVKKKGLMTPALKDKYELHLLRKEDTAELHIATRIVFEKICVESVLDDFLFPKRKKKRDRGYRKIIRAIVGDPLQRKTG